MSQMQRRFATEVLQPHDREREVPTGRTAAAEVPGLAPQVQQLQAQLRVQALEAQAAQGAAARQAEQAAWRALQARIVHALEAVVQRTHRGPWAWFWRGRQVRMERQAALDLLMALRQAQQATDEAAAAPDRSPRSAGTEILAVPK